MDWKMESEDQIKSHQSIFLTLRHRWQVDRPYKEIQVVKHVQSPKGTPRKELLEISMGSFYVYVLIVSGYMGQVLIVDLRYLLLSRMRTLWVNVKPFFSS